MRYLPDSFCSFSRSAIASGDNGSGLGMGDTREVSQKSAMPSSLAMTMPASGRADLSTTPNRREVSWTLL